MHRRPLESLWPRHTFGSLVAESFDGDLSPAASLLLDHSRANSTNNNNSDPLELDQRRELAGVRGDHGAPGCCLI